MCEALHSISSITNNKCKTSVWQARQDLVSKRDPITTVSSPTNGRVNTAGWFPAAVWGTHQCGWQSLALTTGSHYQPRSAKGQLPARNLGNSKPPKPHRSQRERALDSLHSQSVICDRHLSVIGHVDGGARDQESLGKIISALQDIGREDREWVW